MELEREREPMAREIQGQQKFCATGGGPHRLTIRRLGSVGLSSEWADESSERKRWGRGDGKGRLPQFGLCAHSDESETQRANIATFRKRTGGGLPRPQREAARGKQKRQRRPPAAHALAQGRQRVGPGGWRHRDERRRIILSSW